MAVGGWGDMWRGILSSFGSDQQEQPPFQQPDYRTPPFNPNAGAQSFPGVSTPPFNPNAGAQPRPEANNMEEILAQPQPQAPNPNDPSVAATGGEDRYYEQLAEQLRQRYEAERQKKRADTLRAFQTYAADKEAFKAKNRERSVPITVGGRNMSHNTQIYNVGEGAADVGLAGYGAQRADERALGAAERGDMTRQQQMKDMDASMDPETRRLMRMAEMNVPGAKEALIQRMAPRPVKKGELETYIGLSDEDKAKADRYIRLKNAGSTSELDAWIASEQDPAKRAQIEEYIRLRHPHDPKPPKYVNVYGPNDEPMSVAEEDVGPNGYTLVTPASENARKRQREEGVVKQAKTGLSGLLNDMVGSYEELEKAGRTVSPKQDIATNVENYVRSTEYGQIAEGAAGTEAQQIRDRIIQMKPLLIQEIRKATGMTSKAMDSNRELQFYLEAATDPKRGLEANLQALDLLDKMYGLGIGLERLQKRRGGPAKPPLAAAGVETPAAAGGELNYNPATGEFE